MNIRAVLFDLGGVLVDLGGPPLQQEWLNEALSDEENWRRWTQSSVVEAFEKGLISPAEFAEGVIQEFELNVQAEEFIEVFVNWPVGLFPGVSAFLQGLRYQVACYSNTSELHWPRLMDEMGLKNDLDHTFASFQIGFYKPDKRGFQFVVEHIDLQPEEVLFLDDNEANVAAARECGLHAFWVKGLSGVKSVLQELDVM